MAVMTTLLTGCVTAQNPVQATQEASKEKGMGRGKDSSDSIPAEDFEKIHELLREARIVTEDLNAEIAKAAVELETILMPRNMCDYEQIIISKEKLKSFFDKIDSWEKRSKEALIKYETQIKAMTFQLQKSKEIALRQFNRGKVSGELLIKETYRLKRAIASKIAELLIFAVERNGFFEEVEGELVFMEERDLDKYNSLIEDLAQLEQLEEDLLNQVEKIRANREPYQP